VPEEPYETPIGKATVAREGTDATVVTLSLSVHHALDVAEKMAAEHGVDLVDVSSGGAVAHQQIPIGPGYQTGFSARIRRETGVKTGTVGLLTSAGQAEHAVATGQADGVFIARAALRDPHWWLRAAFELGHDLAWPPQYERAVPRHSF